MEFVSFSEIISFFINDIITVLLIFFVLVISLFLSERARENISRSGDYEDNLKDIKLKIETSNSGTDIKTDHEALATSYRKMSEKHNRKVKKTLVNYALVIIVSIGIWNGFLIIMHPSNWPLYVMTAVPCIAYPVLMIYIPETKHIFFISVMLTLLVTSIFSAILSQQE